MKKRMLIVAGVVVGALITAIGFRLLAVGNLRQFARLFHWTGYVIVVGPLYPIAMLGRLIGWDVNSSRFLLSTQFLAVYDTLVCGTLVFLAMKTMQMIADKNNTR